MPNFKSLLQYYNIHIIKLLLCYKFTHYYFVINAHNAKTCTPTPPFPLPPPTKNKNRYPHIIHDTQVEVDTWPSEQERARLNKSNGSTVNKSNDRCSRTNMYDNTINYSLLLYTITYSVLLCMERCNDRWFCSSI